MDGLAQLWSAGDGVTRAVALLLLTMSVSAWVLLTSGVGCRFPKGVPVARVNKVVKRDFGMYQSVEAEPTVDFSRLEEVIIVLSDSKDCEAKSGGQRRPRAKL